MTLKSLSGAVLLAVVAPSVSTGVAQQLQPEAPAPALNGDTRSKPWIKKHQQRHCTSRPAIPTPSNQTSSSWTNDASTGLAEYQC